MYNLLNERDFVETISYYKQYSIEILIPLIKQYERAFNIIVLSLARSYVIKNTKRDV